MLRKLILVFAAIIAFGAATTAFTSEASARRGHGFHGHRGFHGGFHRGGFHRHGFHRGFHRGGWHRHRHFYGPRRFYGGPRFYYGGYGGCYVRRLVPTPWGYRYRLINRCY